jgi:hypothetical protein
MELLLRQDVHIPLAIGKTKFMFLVVEMELAHYMMSMFLIYLILTICNGQNCIRRVLYQDRVDTTLVTLLVINILYTEEVTVMNVLAMFIFLTCVSLILFLLLA